MISTVSTGGETKASKASQGSTPNHRCDSKTDSPKSEDVYLER